MLLDTAGGKLILKGRVALKEGLLEMLVCKSEHQGTRVGLCGRLGRLVP